MGTKYNSIEICTEDYKCYNEYTKSTEIDFEKMYDDIRDIIRILLKNEYQIKVWQDECATSIEYEFKDESVSGSRLEWLDDNEYITKYKTEE